MALTRTGVSVRIDVEIKGEIDALAKSLGRPRNHLITEAIERYIEQHS